MKLPHVRVWVYAGIAFCVAAFLFHISFVEPRKLVVRSVDLPLDSWPEKENGFSIAVLSDFHFSRGESRRMRKIQEAVQKLHPDMIVLLGDFFRSSQQPSEAPSEDELRFFFRHFSAPCGVYAVYGNHEVFYDKKWLSQVAEENGVHFLQNETRIISTSRSDFLLSGVDDLSSSEAALPEKPQGNPLPEILLSHDPFAAFLFHKRDIALILAGHFHGGQICWPWGGTVYPLSFFFTWFPSGLNEVLQRKVFLGNGLGSGCFSVRWNCPPEILFLRLFSTGSVPDVPTFYPRIHPEEEKEFDL